MAKMVPNWSPSDLQLAIPDSRSGAPGERALYQFMKDELPDNWTVVYNTYLELIHDPESRYAVQDYSVRAAPPEKEFLENQFDFLVFTEKGVVNVDAKGWGYQCIGANEVRLGGEARNHNVIERAKQAIHTFDAYVRKKYSDDKAWGAFDSLVVFVFNDPGVRGGVVYGNVNDLVKGTNRLERKILSVLERHNFQYNSSQFFPKHEQALLDEFASAIATNVVYPADYISLENYSRAELSREQQDIYDIIMDKDNAYVWVQGGAGTGKTILGKRCAEEFVAKGKRVLYVCFNRNLAEYLSRGNTHKQQLVYAHFHGLPHALKIPDLNVFKPDKTPDWPRTSANIIQKLPDLMRSCRVPKFDVVIVDEAQDLTKSQMDFFPSLMVKGERHVVIMSDPGQTIYRNLDPWREGDLRARFQNPYQNQQLVVPSTMERNFRNTDKIYNHYKDAIDIAGIKMVPQIKANRVMVEGTPYVPSPVDEFDIPVRKLLEDFLNDKKRCCSDIAILACTKASLDQLPAKITLATGRNVRITEKLGDWLDNKVVYKSTIHAFKGLEANCLIIIDDYDRIPQDELAELEESIGDVRREDRRAFLRYVGESRAKFKLIITTKVT